MTIISDNKNNISPKVSIILLDWSCRESLHSLDYLNKQTVQRNQYEIIWIEYYSKAAMGIKERIEKADAAGKEPPVDKWIVMEMLQNIYYHKHLMYNIGIVACKGEIVCFCDSDAVFSPTFVDSIIWAFEEDRNIVLHIDEVRNIDKRFYPFNYPTIEEILGERCINWKDGKTTGLLDKEDPLHTRNYGSCMCALRKDLIDIGGADEHIDYLGHICGPYDMTFRLVNAGRREVWHQKEVLYHVWHPGATGKHNYLGPHDGRHMSTTALSVRRTGRVMPLVENPAIRMLRLKQDVKEESLLLQTIREEEIENWATYKLKKFTRKLENFMKYKTVWLWFFKILIKQFYMKVKVTTFSKKSMFTDIGRKFFYVWNFFKNMAQYNIYVIEECARCLQKINSDKGAETAVYGTGNIAEILYILSRYTPVKIHAVYDDFVEKKRFKGLYVLPLEAITNYKGPVIIASVVNVEEKIKTLKDMGVDVSRIMVLGY